MANKFLEEAHHYRSPLICKGVAQRFMSFALSALCLCDLVLNQANTT
jgi:hypothetical protein